MWNHGNVLDQIKIKFKISSSKVAVVAGLPNVELPNAGLSNAKNESERKQTELQFEFIRCIFIQEISAINS